MPTRTKPFYVHPTCAIRLADVVAVLVLDDGTGAVWFRADPMRMEITAPQVEGLLAMLQAYWEAPPA